VITIVNLGLRKMLGVEGPNIPPAMVEVMRAEGGLRWLRWG